MASLQLMQETLEVFGDLVLEALADNRSQKGQLMPRLLADELQLVLDQIVGTTKTDTDDKQMKTGSAFCALCSGLSDAEPFENVA